MVWFGRYARCLKREDNSRLLTSYFGRECYALDLADPFIRRDKRDTRDNKEKVHGKEFHTGGAVCIHPPFFSDGDPGGNKGRRCAVAGHDMDCSEIFCYFCSVDFQF